MHRLEKFPETSLRDEVFARLERVANYAILTPTEQAVYEADLRWESEYDEALGAGKREAMTEWLAEGKAKEAARIAANLFANGLDEEFVSKSTGLYLKEVRALKSCTN